MRWDSSANLDCQTARALRPDQLGGYRERRSGVVYYYIIYAPHHVFQHQHQRRKCYSAIPTPFNPDLSQQERDRVS